MLTMYSAASFTAFSEATAPDSPTGCAAPDVGSRRHRRHVRRQQDERASGAARAPDGETYPITGTFAFKIACVICRIDESSPAGRIDASAARPRRPRRRRRRCRPPRGRPRRDRRRRRCAARRPGEADWASAPWALSDRHAAARRGEHRCASEDHHVTAFIIAPARTDGDVGPTGDGSVGPNEPRATRRRMAPRMA